jgi:OHCU decarboxylase
LPLPRRRGRQPQDDEHRQPGRAEGLRRFLDYIAGLDKVWVARRIDIARHWAEHHPYKAPRLSPSQMDATTFLQTFGGIYEHSPFIAQRAYEAELAPAHDTAFGIHVALRNQFRMATPDERLGVLNAHPDLAGKLAAAKRLTAESTAEQASAGLDALTDDERTRFTELNTAYVEKFGFPFIIAVRDNTKASILSAFKTRIANDRPTEFATACAQVERIAQLRIEALFTD